MEPVPEKQMSNYCRFLLDTKIEEILQPPTHTLSAMRTIGSVGNSEAYIQIQSSNWKFHSHPFDIGLIVIFRGDFTFFGWLGKVMGVQVPTQMTRVFPIN